MFCGNIRVEGVLVVKITPRERGGAEHRPDRRTAGMRTEQAPTRESPVGEPSELDNDQHDDPSPHTDDRSGTTRVTAFLPTDVWARVGIYAKVHRITKTATLRRAISLLWFVHTRPGAQLLCEYPDGRVDRLFFLDDQEAPAEIVQRDQEATPEVVGAGASA
jgi:hypothetical protein